MSLFATQVSKQNRSVAAAGGPLGPAIRTLGYVVALSIGAALLAVTVPGLAGYHNITITGGSMGSALPIGSVAVTRTIDYGDVREGDIIAFQRPSASVPVVHRVVEIRGSDAGRVAFTRGDANSQNDPEALRLEGRGDEVVYHVPWAGYALVFVRTPGGIAVTIFITALWLVHGRRRLRTIEAHAESTAAA